MHEEKHCYAYYFWRPLLCLRSSPFTQFVDNNFPCSISCCGSWAFAALPIPHLLPVPGTMANSPLYAVVWLLLLFFVAWPVAWFLAGVWIFIQVCPCDCALVFRNVKCVHPSVTRRIFRRITRSSTDQKVMSWPCIDISYWLTVCRPFDSKPFESLSPIFKQINDFLEKLITWPRDVGQAILTCQTTFPAPSLST